MADTQRIKEQKSIYSVNESLALTVVAVVISDIKAFQAKLEEIKVSIYL